MRRLMRRTAFRLARKDLLRFLDDHQEDLLVIFREEIQKLDNRVEEEKAFIDIHMVPLGEEILHAVLNTLKRFLREC